MGAWNKRDIWLRVPPGGEGGGKGGARDGPSGGSQRFAAVIARRPVEGACAGPRRKNTPFPTKSY